MYTVLAVLPTRMCFGDLDCSGPIPSSPVLEVGMSHVSPTYTVTSRTEFSCKYVLERYFTFSLLLWNYLIQTFFFLILR